MNTFPRELTVDNGQTLMLEPSILLLCFTEMPASKVLSRQLKDLGIEIVNNPGASHTKGILINNTRTRIWVRTENQSAFSEELYQGIVKMFSKSLQWIGPL